MKKIFKQSTKGITLIALVITIIVLLILAGVSVITLTGENGILTRTTNVSKTNVHAAVVDAIALAYNEYQVDINLANTTKNASTNPIKLADTAIITKETTFLEYLEIKGYADSSGILNVKNLVGSEQAYGKGTDSTDVYKIEEKSNKYIVTYYDENSSETEIWTVAISNDDYNEGKSEQETPDPPHAESRSAGTITVESIESMEYSVDEGDTYKQGNGSYIEFGGLTPGMDVEVICRYMETDTHYASDWSEPTKVEVKKEEQEKPEPPDARSDEPTSITVNNPWYQQNLEYSIDNGETTIPGNGQLKVYFDGLTPGEIYYVICRKIGDDTHYASDWSEPTKVEVMKE